jgi:hypothetical protein
MPFERFFKYVYFIIIHFIAFSLMYSQNLEMLGYGIGITMSFITAGFLWLDIYNSPKKNDPVIFVILLGILAGIISLFMFAKFLTNIHAKYNAKGSKIMLTKENRKRLDTFKSLYITDYVLIGTISLMFFLAYKNTDGTYMPFFKIPENVFSSDSVFFVLKSLLSVSTLSVSGYMIYVANELSKQNSKQLYIPEKDSPDTIKKFPYKKPKGLGLGGISDFFRNVNLDYLVNYNIIRSD